MLTNKILNFIKTSEFFLYCSQASNICTTLFVAWSVTSYATLSIYGSFIALTSLTTILGNLIGFRTNEAVVKFLKIAMVTKDHALYRMTLLFGIILDAFLAFIVITSLYIFSDFISQNLLNDISQSYEVKIFSIYSVFTILGGVSIGYFTAQERFKSLAALTIICNILRIALISYYLIIGNLSLESLIKSYLYSSLIYFLPLIKIYYLILIKYIRYPIFQDKKLINEFINFALKTFFSSFIKSGNQGLDNIAISIIINTEALGLYGLMKKFYSLFHFIVAPFTTIWYPRFVESFEKQQSDLYGIISKFNKTYLKLFIFVPFFGLLCILYLNTINQQITIYLIIAISLCGLATFVQASLWWARPFSNAVNPNYSIFMNIYVTIILLPSLYIFVNLFGILGGHLSILIVNLAAYLYFRKKLSLLA